MTAYYNEFDPKAAAWLRELIARGHIAPGDVDTRSILDVSPDDLRSYAQCHFFAGIGVWSYALRCAGWSDDRPVWTGSCPCQPFSAAGKGGGFDDERHLWPAWQHLIAERRPDVVFGEQVSSKDGLGWLDLVSADLEGAGYAVGALDSCAAGVGAPHIRQRLYWVADAGGTGLPFGSIADDGQGALRVEGEATAASGLHGGLADAAQQLNDGSWRGGSRRWAEHSDGGTVGGLADAKCAAQPRQRFERREDLRNQDAEGFARGSVASVLGINSGDARMLCERKTVGGLADDARRSERQRNDTPARYWNTSTSTCGDDRLERTGQTNGFWRSADWLRCRDDRWRPVEPGTFPLAHGTAARVGRLRGYGNGLVAPHAQGFIEAYLETKAIEGEVIDDRHLRLEVDIFG